MSLADELNKTLLARSRDNGPLGFGYRPAWATLARNLGRPIAAEEFDAAVRDLVSAGVLSGREVGSTSALVLKSDKPNVTREAKLLPDVDEWLQQEWLLSQQFESADILDRVIENTSAARVSGAGLHAHPDFVAGFLCARRTQIAMNYLETASFELKAADADMNRATQEAAKHAEYVNRAHLIWHIDGEAAGEDREAALLKACESYDIGLVVFGRADDFASYRILREPTRRERDVVMLEQFLRERVKDQTFNRLVGKEAGDVG